MEFLVNNGTHSGRRFFESLCVDHVAEPVPEKAGREVKVLKAVSFAVAAGVMLKIVAEVLGDLQPGALERCRRGDIFPLNTRLREKEHLRGVRYREFLKKAAEQGSSRSPPRTSAH